MEKAIVRNEPSLSDVVAKAESKGWELENIDFGDIAICHSCGEILLLDDEAYESHDSNILCSACSVLCEACDQYFTEDKMVSLEECTSSGARVCESCYKENDKSDKLDVDKLAVEMSSHAEDEIAEFVKLYFGKEMKDLTKEENHEIDCFGAFGVSEWLRDNRKD